MGESIKRLLDLDAKDFLTLSKDYLLKSIKAAEGRTIMSEVQGTVDPVPFNVTNAEIARAFGADLILLNKFDIYDLKIGAMPEAEDPIRKLRKMVGRPIGVNLEPIDEQVEMIYRRSNISKGRQANIENYKLVESLGFDMVLLTGNPSSGVTCQRIAEELSQLRKYFSGIVIAGKMHTAGVNEDLFDRGTLQSFIDGGADIILLPAAGTTPGVTIEALHEATKFIQSQGVLVIAAIGTSQEASEKETIRQIALWNKMAGVDIHHIGATGYAGMSPYENIYTLSMAVRGLRHTVRMMAASNDR